MKTNFIDTFRLLFRKDKKPFLQLYAILGFYPHNIKLYQLALKHKSMVHQEREERRQRGESRRLDFKSSLNNERLEFLGDAILGAIVADILYRHYGTKQEGFLTSTRSKIVRRSSLNKLAVDLGLDKLILHSNSTNNAHNSYMNGNAFEAFFGAIYLDRGYDYCYRFMEERVFRKYINVEKLVNEDENYKSTFIEWCQKYQFKFKFVNQEKRENNVPKFISEVSIEGIVCGRGEGYSKKESDQNAAKEALANIRRDNSVRDKVRNAIAEKKQRAKLQSEADKARLQAEAAEAQQQADVEKETLQTEASNPVPQTE